MLARRFEPMSEEAFLRWEDHQEERHELIDGVPVPRRLRMMAGGTAVHAHMGARIVTALNNRLGDGPCEAAGSDLKVRIRPGQMRYPDVTVNCAEPDDTFIAGDPRAVFEVLSPSNTLKIQEELKEDYQSVASIVHVALVERRVPFISLWTRVGDGWRRTQADGLDASLDLPAFGFALPLVEVYRRMRFPEA